MPYLYSVFMNIAEELEQATQDRFIPSLDLHGQTRHDVEWQIDMLLTEHPGECVRIIHGRGEGIIASAVMTYLRQLERQKHSPIIGIKRDTFTHSLVVRVR